MDDWQLKPASDLGMPMGERLRSVRRERGSGPWLLHLVCWWGVEMFMRVYCRLRVVGRENLPAGESFVLVANHSSHMDTLALASALPRGWRPDVYPIAAGDTFFTTKVKMVFSALLINALPMWRRGAVNHSLADLRKRLESGRCIFIIFPEGTRSRAGKMGDFKAGIGMMLAGSKTAVVPCYLDGTFAVLPAGKRLPRRGCVQVRLGQVMRFEGIANDRQGWEQIADALQVAVSGLHPVV